MSRHNLNKEPLRFPKELGTNDVPNFIYFKPSKIDFGEFNKDFFGNYGNSFETTDFGGSVAYTPEAAQADQHRLGIGGIVDSIANGAKSIVSSVLSGNLNLTGKVDLFGGKVSAKLDIGNLGINTEGIQDVSKLKPMPGIGLYMPPEIDHKTSAKYSASEIGAAAAGFLEGQENVAGLINSSGGTVASEFMSTLASAALNTGAGAAVDKLKGVKGVANTFQRATGRVANSYSFAMFGGMEHRSFNYTFRLIARSEEDTKMIKRICDTFMAYMLPTRTPNMDFHLYDIPYRWDVKYYRFEEENMFMDQPNECFLSSVDVKYSGEGMGHTYNSGAPLIVDLSLNFMEIEPLFNVEGKKSLSDFDKEFEDAMIQDINNRG